MVNINNFLQKFAIEIQLKCIMLFDPFAIKRFFN